jgi:hypothetical protein
MLKKNLKDLKNTKLKMDPKEDKKAKQGNQINIELSEETAEGVYANLAMILNALQDNIKKYENTFGDIKSIDEAPKFPMNFGGTVGEA